MDNKLLKEYDNIINTAFYGNTKKKVRDRSNSKFLEPDSTGKMYEIRIKHQSQDLKIQATRTFLLSKTREYLLENQIV